MSRKPKEPVVDEEGKSDKEKLLSWAERITRALEVLATEKILSGPAELALEAFRKLAPQLAKLPDGYETTAFTRPRSKIGVGARAHLKPEFAVYYEGAFTPEDELEVVWAPPPELDRKGQPRLLKVRCGKLIQTVQQSHLNW